MPLDFVTVSGSPWQPPTDTAMPKSKTEPAPSHKGFRVYGHPPDDLAAARAKAEKDEGTFDEQAWRRNTKLRAVTKAFSLPSAADAAADIARRTGWLDVVVRELVKGKDRGGLL